MAIYAIDVKNDRTGAVLARDVHVDCEMFSLPEEVLLLKLSLATNEMGKKANRDKYDFRLPERDYAAAVRKIERRVIVVEKHRTLVSRT